MKPELGKSAQGASCVSVREKLTNTLKGSLELVCVDYCVDYCSKYHLICFSF